MVSCCKAFYFSEMFFDLSLLLMLLILFYSIWKLLLGLMYKECTLHIVLWLIMFEKK